MFIICMKRNVVEKSMNYDIFTNAKNTSPYIPYHILCRIDFYANLILFYKKKKYSKVLFHSLT